jgi:hypothetical protein
MANFVKVGGGSISYVNYKETQAGQVLVEGVYLTSRRAGKFDSLQHHFRKETGDTVVLPSSGILNNLVENHLSKGDKVRVVYKGKVKLKRGKFAGTEAHDFDVLKDADYVNTTPAGSDEYDEEDVAPQTTSSFEEDEEAEPTPALRKLVQSEPEEAPKKLSGQDILAKYRKKA